MNLQLVRQRTVDSHISTSLGLSKLQIIIQYSICFLAIESPANLN